MLLCTYYGPKILKYFWLISTNTLKLNSSISIQEKLNNLPKIPEPKISKTVFQSTFHSLFPAISQAKKDIIINVCRGKQ